MKDLAKMAGIIALAAVIGFSMAACATIGGGGGPDSASGTWNFGGEKLVLSNGAFTAFEGDVEFAKGSYSASGSRISMTFTHFAGAFITREAGLPELRLSPDQWYTQQAFRTALINYIVGQGASQAQAEALYNQELAADMNKLFGRVTGTVSGDTLNILGGVYTK